MILKRAKNILRSGGLKLVLLTTNKAYFEVINGDKKYDVVYDRNTKSFTCTCRHFTIKGNKCSHIVASKSYGMRMGIVQ